MSIYASPSFVGHSLWLVPAGTARTLLQKVVNTQAAALKSPTFLPHMTMIAGMMHPVDEIMKHSRAVAASVPPFKGRVRGVEVGTMYFQSVYARIESEGEAGRPVMAANAAAQAEFTPGESATYMPHISLVYGDHDVDIKTGIAEQLSTSLTDTEFVIDAVQVWSTQGTVDEWYLVEELPLTGAGDESAPKAAAAAEDESKSAST